ncbi:MAG: radical SAM protein [Thermodesulfobacteriota bacterium]
MTVETRTPYKDGMGVITLTIYTRPHDCTGRCLYCFTEEGMPRSALLHSDTKRALDCDWKPRKQLEKLFGMYGIQHKMGNKYGINILGGSFTNYSQEYLRHYFKEVYDFFSQKQSSSLQEAKHHHLDSSDHICRLSVATRPNLVDEEWCRFLVELGVSEVQIGVQSIREDVLEINRRGHSVEDVKTATKLLKYYGFAIVYHVMLGMVGSNLPDEVEDISIKLWEPGYCPDYLKIYPCIATNQANHNVSPSEWFKYRWKPLSDESFFEALLTIKKRIPRYLFIIRIQRILPPDLIKYGPKTVVDRAQFLGLCNCIFHRALPVVGMQSSLDTTKVRYLYHRQDCGVTIEAAIGKLCLGYCRMEIICRTGVLRELRVIGKMLGVGCVRSDNMTAQHKGIGRSMLQLAFEYACNNGAKALSVAAIPGAVRYFERIGCNVRDGKLMMVPDENAIPVNSAGGTDNQLS